MHEASRESHAERSHRPSGEPLEITTVDSADGLERHRPEWEALADQALEANAFYEPFFLLPALRAFGPRGPAQQTLLVWQRDARSDRRALVGLFPLVRTPRYSGLPVAHLHSWTNDYLALATPLVHRRVAREVLLTLLDWLTGESGASFLELRALRSGGPLGEVLLDCLNERRLAPYRKDFSTRAFLNLHASSEAYLEEALSKEARRKWKGKLRNLQGMGTVQWDVLQPAQEARRWAEEFLALEAAGWKGARGTAAACRPNERAFFAQVVEEAHARRHLHMLALRVDGKAIAMKCNLLSQDGSFAWKIAYDEAYASCSPGLLLEVENIAEHHTLRRWQDSCADPASRMFRELWLDRRCLETLIVPAQNPASELLVASLPLMRWGKRLLERFRELQAPSRG